MACAALCMLLASLGTSIANIALPALTIAFAAPLASVQWVVIAYLAAMTATALLAGRLGDRFGHRNILLAGLALFLVASLACAAATELWALVAARTVQGAAAACLMVLTVAMMRSTVGPQRVGRAMGMLGTMAAVGTALGPSLGGLLLALLPWWSVFAVLVPLAALALLLGWRVLPKGAEAVAGTGFGWVLLRQRQFVLRLVANAVVALVMMTTLIVGPFYLTLGLGLSTAAMGAVMSVGPVISILSGIPSGRLTDAIGAERVTGLGLVAMCAGAGALVMLPGVLGLTGYLLAIAVLTPGYQMFQAANTAGAMAASPADRRGMTSGLLGLARNIGLIGGASVMGVVFATGVGTDELTEATPASIGAGLQLAFGICAVLLAMVLAVGRMKQEARGQEIG
ncbi:MFS transporter [Algicella marina]|uniref:MFS transporter n=1 Tax=Algicella marina TaxID=2683284 RepID=A0A6P1T742_9RHOB|nr:MFS transporter [Algicella marina]